MTSVSNNVYIDKVADIFNKYNNTYHSAIKMKPADVNSSTYIDFNKENEKEDPRFKVGDHKRMSKLKTFLQKITFQTGVKKFLWLKKLKILICWQTLLVILMVMKLLERLWKRSGKKRTKKSSELKK